MSYFGNQFDEVRDLPVVITGIRKPNPDFSTVIIDARAGDDLVLWRTAAAKAARLGVGDKILISGSINLHGENSEHEPVAMLTSVRFKGAIPNE